MTIKKKLYYAFAVTLLLFSISVTSFFVVTNNFEDFAEVKIGNSMKEADLVQMLLNKNHSLMLKINEVLLVVHGMHIGHELQPQSSMIMSMTEMLEHTKELGVHIKHCQVLYKKDDSEVRQFRKLESAINELIEKTYLFIEMWEDENDEADIVQYYQENIHFQAEATEYLLKTQYNRSLGEVIEQQEQFKVLLADGQKIIAVSTMVIFMLIFGIVHRNAKSISTPLEKLKQQALAISEGNYDVQIEVASKDEIGQLAEAFNYMATTISEEIEGRIRAEDAQRRSQKMDAIGQLTGGIAHDFNNILAIILGNLEILKTKIPDNDKLLERIETINKAGLRAADLTKQLLSFSRSQAAQLTVTNINQAIGEMDSLIARSLTPEVEVEYQFADKLWLTEIDPGDFKDTLLNLCINAHDAMAGHGHLIIETRNTTLENEYCIQNTDATPGQYVELSVSDNGEGIFIKRSKGCIKVYSEPGIGTTFRLYLPRVHGEEPLNEQDDEQTETLPHGQETILAVDDEAMLLELTRESLETLGYRVLIASDGEQALQRLNEEPNIDLLFSDVVMPGGINGYELAKQATASRPNLKVLLTSGYTEKAMRHNGNARFNDNLLSKPYSRSDLAHQVRLMLDT